MKNLGLRSADHNVITVAKALDIPFARIALSVIYIWFGALKLIGMSPANPMVAALLLKTLPFISSGTFFIILGVVEILIGIIFLIRGWERISLILLTLHLITTFMPLVLLPGLTWQAFLVPTMEGQYIIKNLLIIAIAIDIAASLRPLGSKRG